MDSASKPFVADYHGQTTIHPLGLAMVVVMGVAMLLVPRRYAIWPIIVIVCFVPSAQRLVIGGADFTLLRLMVLFGTLRVLRWQEWRGFQWKALDWAVLAWALYGFLTVVLRIGPGVLLNRLGTLYDILGMYFVFRMLVRDWDDVRATIRGLMWATIPVTAFIAVEWATARNVFAVFGGVPEVTAVRDGRLRCQGAFAHSILAGCFFAALLPLFAALWWDRRISRLLVILSASSAVFIVIASGSATPITGLIFAAVGAMMFPLRHWTRSIRWGLLVAMVALHLVMIAPVWHLISRINVSSGSAWHRFALVDGAIRHLHEWWLVGTSVGSAHWGHFTFDVTNLYIVQGLHGGLLLLALFIATIAVAFRAVGMIWRTAGSDRPKLILAWGIGVSLFVHATNHFGVSYFGQIWMGWYLCLAMVGSLAPRPGERVVSAVARPKRQLLAPAGSGTIDVDRAGTAVAVPARATIK